MQMLWLILLVSLISHGHCDDRSRADGAAATLMKYYNANVGLFQEHSGQQLWWTGANCLTAIIDYMILTGSKQYMSVIQTSFEKGIKHPGTKDFTNEFLDDSGWWGLAWVRAYDLTKEKKYLQMAEHITDYMWTYHDNVCKGGIYWKNDKKYKSSISNELFIKLAASLHSRGGDSKYLNQAKDVWNWFKASGVINGEHLVNDGIGLPSCKPQGATFTYNQGVILGGLVELFKATNDRGYLNDAESIANAATKSSNLNQNGVLKDGSDACNNDGASFKGAYIRGLAELSRALGNHPYHDYIEKNAESAYAHDRNNNNEYGLRWTGPFKESADHSTGASCQHSALDLMNAALK